MGKKSIAKYRIQAADIFLQELADDIKAHEQAAVRANCETHARTVLGLPCRDPGCDLHGAELDEVGR